MYLINIYSIDEILLKCFFCLWHIFSLFVIVIDRLIIFILPDLLQNYYWIIFVLLMFDLRNTLNLLDKWKDFVWFTISRKHSLKCHSQDWWLAIALIWWRVDCFFLMRNCKLRISGLLSSARGWDHRTRSGRDWWLWQGCWTLPTFWLDRTASWWSGSQSSPGSSRSCPPDMARYSSL